MPITPASISWQPPSLDEIRAALPEFDFLELIGRGGMGAVFKAVQTSLHRTVAIKVLPEALMERTDAGYAARFEREARIMAGLNHPGIVALYAFGRTEGGLLYMVMEFVDGTDLARRLETSGTLAPEECAGLLTQICDALEAAHRAGVVHRDLKPANILLTPDGKPKIADFGLAREPDAAADGLTQSGLISGTAEFTAPELLTPGATPDARADLYALGVMLYRMLTGELPRGRWKLPGARRADARFDAVIQKAMQPLPELRFQSTAELRRELRRVRGGCRKRKSVLLFSAAALFAAAMWFWWPRGASPATVADELSTHVTHTQDAGPGSLRQAFINAQKKAGADSITFDPALSGQTIRLTSVRITIARESEVKDISDWSPITVDARALPGGLTIHCDTGDGWIFAERASVTLRGLTFTGGRGAYGGFLLNSGGLTVEDCVFQDNHASVNGGALGNNGTLRLVRCAFSGNSAQKNGGALNSLGTVIAEDCTFSGNTGGGGGAVIIGGGSAEFTRCTFAGNEARRIGGAVALYAAVKATHCTFAGNKCSGTAADTHGGGAFGFMETDATLAIDACIVAGNTAATGNGPDIWRQAGKVSAVRSLIGIADDTGITASEGNFTGTAAAPLDAKLSPLGDYGGSTQTMPPLPDSPAKASAKGSAATVDQRGEKITGVPSIGAAQ